MSTATDVIRFCQEQNIRFIDFRFTDIPGTNQHFSIPVSQLDESVFEDGLGFDGSSIRGWRAINDSDMVVIPDPATMVVDPFFEHATLIMYCGIKDPITGEDYDKDPRYVARKAVDYLASTGIADTAYFGPEAEFFVFDRLAYSNSPSSAYYEVDSEEGIWNSGTYDSETVGHKNRDKEGYFPVPPHDTLQDMRSEMVEIMEAMGLEVECHHHEVAGPGQNEIDIRFDELLRTADKMMTYKYVVKNVAARHGKGATFMPKPVFKENGNGMHTHQSLWKDGKPLFAGDGYAGLSEMALHYIGGILKHSPAILAFAAPTTNSYKRLVPGFEAPVSLVYSMRNRSAAIRIPMYNNNPKSKRIEFRSPDPTANPYLAFSAMMLAGLDGIKNKIDPGKAMDKNMYDLSKDEQADIVMVPSSLNEALDALEADHAFLQAGDVFSDDLISSYLDFRRGQADELRLRPHPYEFEMYHDA